MRARSPGVGEAAYLPLRRLEWEPAAERQGCSPVLLMGTTSGNPQTSRMVIPEDYVCKPSDTSVKAHRWKKDVGVGGRD